MTITQTVDIPADRRLVIDVPREIPVGKTILAFTPASVQESTDQGTERTPSCKSISQYFGILSPDTYGDPVSYQRKLRNEWDD